MSRARCQSVAMTQRALPTRLNLQDVRDLIASKAALDAVTNALRSTNWAGAGTSIAALATVDQLICRLYNRAEPYWLRYIGAAPPGAPAEASEADQPIDTGDTILSRP